MLQTMRTNVHDVAHECERLMNDVEQGTAALSSIAFALKMNNLKVSSSQLVVQIVNHALLICGIMGYKMTRVWRWVATFVTRTLPL